MIRLIDVWKTYNYGKVTALKGITLDFKENVFYMIIGPSGSGKSTLLNIITGVDIPSKGKVIVDNTEISSLPEGHRRKFRLRNFGIVSQFYYLVPYLTALENVMLPLRFLGYKYSDAKEIALNALKMVNAMHLCDKYPVEMSAGEMQRVAIARAIAPKPKYIIADEPTAALDWNSKIRIWSLFRKLKKELGITIISVSHEINFTKYADVLIELRDGEIHDIKNVYTENSEK